MIFCLQVPSDTAPRSDGEIGAGTGRVGLVGDSGTTKPSKAGARRLVPPYLLILGLEGTSQPLVCPTLCAYLVLEGTSQQLICPA